jgi:NADPH-dependent 7-cyano-7-deazaguanine reductase QueF
VGTLSKAKRKTHFTTASSGSLLRLYENKKNSDEKALNRIEREILNKRLPKTIAVCGYWKKRV